MSLLESMNRFSGEGAPEIQTGTTGFRRSVVYLCCIAAAGVLVWRSVDIQLNEGAFLQGQGIARHERVVAMPTHRGRILDRNGSPLAVSAPVESVWAIPKLLRQQPDRMADLAKRLGVSKNFVAKRAQSDRQFAYLRRHMIPEDAAEVMAMDLDGVHTLREYRRYYPAAEVVAQVLGFTNIDDAGQEGLELAFESWLAGEPGKRRVIKDRLGRVIGDLGVKREPRPGRDLNLSLDLRIQYLAYRELKAAVSKHKAKAGTAVVMDPRTGELLAVVNQPSFNPNNRRRFKIETLRNRAFTDEFEPGSTMKPLTVLAALSSGKYHPDTVVDTNPGFFSVSGKPVKDMRNYGKIDVAGVITHSSNVGASKLALSVGSEHFSKVIHAAGLGETTGSGFPGERSGSVRPWRDWRPIEQATQSFGYGLSVTAAQLAHAYSVLAADGVSRPLTFLRTDEPVKAERMFSVGDVRRVRAMMETVVSPIGTGWRARVPGYQVAGKTGTVHKNIAGGYAEHRYLSLFAGMAPARDPRLVMVVIIDEPTAGEHFGGRVAGPVFSKVMSSALRLLNVPPSNDEEQKPFAPPALVKTAKAQVRT